MDPQIKIPQDLNEITNLLCINQATNVYASPDCYWLKDGIDIVFGEDKEKMYNEGGCINPIDTWYYDNYTAFSYVPDTGGEKEIIIFSNNKKI